MPHPRDLLAAIVAPCRQAIETRFLGPTDHRDPRVKATCAAGTMTVDWDDRLDERENHAAAAAALAAKLEWATFANFASRYAMGSTRDGYVFVDIYTRADVSVQKDS